jgi:hypothetical protein
MDMLGLLELKKLLFISDKKLVDIHLPEPTPKLLAAKDHLPTPCFVES